MNKIDLIIDALSVAQNSVWSALNQEALAAARELQALKPVAYVGGLNEFDAMRLKSEGFHMYTPLYALDEVTK
jgi:hypothetical protein